MWSAMTPSNKAYLWAMASVVLLFWLTVTPGLLLPEDEESTVLLFDGVCELCNGLVHFVADHDPHGRVKMGALQHQPSLIARYGAPDDLSTVVLIQDGKAFTHSTAVLRLLALLEMPYNYASVFIVVPSFIRDFVYRLVAQSRYAIFGKMDTCRAPTKELEARFIDPEVDLTKEEL